MFCAVFKCVRAECFLSEITALQEQNLYRVLFEP